jgi:hypothetical protein
MPDKEAVEASGNMSCSSLVKSVYLSLFLLVTLTAFMHTFYPTTLLSDEPSFVILSTFSSKLSIIGHVPLRLVRILTFRYITDYSTFLIRKIGPSRFDCAHRDAYLHTVLNVCSTQCHLS